MIFGTWYGGENKKGIFSLMNYWLPNEVCGHERLCQDRIVTLTARRFGRARSRCTALRTSGKRAIRVSSSDFPARVRQPSVLTTTARSLEMTSTDGMRMASSTLRVSLKIVLNNVFCAPHEAKFCILLQVDATLRRSTSQRRRSLISTGQSPKMRCLRTLP